MNDGLFGGSGDLELEKRATKTAAHLSRLS